MIGMWILCYDPTRDKKRFIKCSACGCEFDKLSTCALKNCPNCKAEMW